MGRPLADASGARASFDQLWWPALGGLGLGVTGYFVLRILSVEYGTIADRENPRKIVGYLGRAAVLEARLHRLTEDHAREPGWLKTTLRTRPS